MTRAERNLYAPPDVRSSDGRASARPHWTRWLGWLEVAAAPGLFLLVSWHHLFRDDSAMAAMLWLWSIPLACFVYFVPGMLLLLAPRWGVLGQLFPAAFTAYVAFLVLAGALTSPW